MTEFFEQLQEFSTRVFALQEIEETISPWHGRNFVGGHPIGAVLHYTAGNDILRAIRWFMKRKYEANVSAHVVVADGWPEDAQELAHDLPLVENLPAMVVQCVPPNRTAYHATWVNGMCYGIEMVNTGEVRRGDDGGWAWWPNDWTRPWVSEKDPVELYGRCWEPYTPEQILTVVEVLRQLHKGYGPLSRYMVVGHEHVEEEKWDPGPLFPLHGVRLALYENLDPGVYQWFKQFKDDPQYGGCWRVGLAMEWAALVAYSCDSITAWDKFAGDLRGRFLKGGQIFGSLGKAALQALGYYTSPPLGGGLMSEGRHSVEIFQRMMGLKVDGLPGINTRRALVSRLEERGILE